MLILMSTAKGTHPSEEELELYSLGRLEEGQSTPIEEHLLVCESCRRQVEEFDEFAAAMRAALVETEAPKQAPEPWTARLARLAAVPKPVWAGALAAAIALVLLLPWQQRTQPPYPVELEALRQAAVAAAPQGRPLVLTVDLTGLTGEPAYDLEIVDATARLVWRGTVRSEGDKAVLALHDGLRAGRYWVRIHQPGTGELLREFGLEVD